MLLFLSKQARAILFLNIRSLGTISCSRLSRKREYGKDNAGITANHEYKYGKKVRIVHKTVQCW